MKKTVVMLLLFIGLNNLAWANAEVLTLGTKQQWKPYHIDTPHGADGIAVRALSCIMARINQPYVIVKKPWKRVQYETKFAKLDGFFSASKNSERDSYATLSKVFLPQTRSFYLLKKNYPSMSLTFDEMKRELSFSARAGSNAVKSLLKNNFPVVIEPKTEMQLLKLLDKNRINAILENTWVFEALIKKENRSLNEFHVIPFEEKNMGVYFSHQYLKKHPSFLAKFNENVDACSLLK